MKIFIHGLESSGSGYKGRFFKKIFPDILCPDFQGDFNVRMRKLKNILNNKKDILIIGSSYGGLMATKFAYDFPDKVKKLILLAPAIIFENIITDEMKINVSAVIYHGIKDNVVPLQETRKLAEKVFPVLNFIEVDDDHFLHKTIYKIKWDELI